MSAPDLYPELVGALRDAAAGAFQPKFYRVRVSPRRVKRYRRPGMASPLTSREARAVQAMHYLEGGSISSLARLFCRDRATIRKALTDAEFQAYVESTRGSHR